MLHGMAEPCRGVPMPPVAGLRHPPWASSSPGWRTWCGGLLENTSNESFVRHPSPRPEPSTSCSPPPDVDELPAAPGPRPALHRSRGPVALPARARVQVAPALGPRRHGRRRGRSRRRARRNGPRADRRRAGRTAADAARRPVDPGVVVAAAACGVAEADAAVAPPSRRPRRGATRRGRTGRRAVPGGRPAGAPPGHRCARCVEAGKPWDQSDADVCEARRPASTTAERCCASAATADLVQSPPGEANRMTYQGKGVCRSSRRGLPPRHPHRHDGGRPRGRQPGDPQARRAGPARRVHAWWTPWSRPVLRPG